MSEESNSRQTYWPNARQTEELEKDRKRLHLLIKKLDIHTKIKISGRRCFYIDHYNREGTFMIDMLEEAVEHLRNKNIRITWKIDTNMAYYHCDEWTYYEDPYWKLITHGDSLVLYFINGINYEHFLQLIGTVNRNLLRHILG